MGTSTTKEAKEYFEELRVVNYKWDDDITSNDSIDLAFNKKRSDDRKTWLQNYDYGKVLDPDSLEVSYSEFIHKELIHFSNDDLRRSIRMWLVETIAKKDFNGFKEISKRSKSLNFQVMSASIQLIMVKFRYNDSEKMAQDAGSNNINLFLPNGQFGTRLMGGKDSRVQDILLL